MGVQKLTSLLGTVDAEIEAFSTENLKLSEVLSLEPGLGQNVLLCMFRPLPEILPG